MVVSVVISVVIFLKMGLYNASSTDENKLRLDFRNYIKENLNFKKERITKKIVNQIIYGF